MTGMVGREEEGRGLGITHWWERSGNYTLGMEEGLRVGPHGELQPVGV